MEGFFLGTADVGCTISAAHLCSTVFFFSLSLSLRVPRPRLSEWDADGAGQAGTPECRGLCPARPLSPPHTLASLCLHVPPHPWLLLRVSPALAIPAWPGPSPAGETRPARSPRSPRLYSPGCAPGERVSPSYLRLDHFQTHRDPATRSPAEPGVCRARHWLQSRRPSLPSPKAAAPQGGCRQTRTPQISG